MLVKLEVSHDTRATPQAGEEEDRGDARERKGPPLPVTGDTILADLLGHPVRGVGRKGRGHHGEASEPPGHRASRGEELGSAFGRALRIEERRNEADEDGCGNDGPVDPG